MNVQEVAAQYGEYLIEKRRYFHQHPEVSTKEYHSSKAIKEALDEIGVSWRPCGLETGVLVTIQGAKPGKTILLRGDMDALTVQETTGAPYASKNEGIMHACGHDAHTSILLAVAEWAVRNKEHLVGKYKFIFQPAEEGVRGGLAVANGGIFDDVDEILCFHVGSECKLGEVGYLATTKLNVSFEGAPAHAGSNPEAGKSALLAACNAATLVAGIPRHSGGLTRVCVGKLEAGESRNVIPAHARMEIETRGATSDLDAFMVDHVKRIVRGTEAAFDVKAKIEKVGSAANLETDPEVLARLAKITEQMESVEKTNFIRFVPASEDCTWLIRRVREHGGKAGYFLFGCNHHGHHRGDFSIQDEKSMPVAFEMLTKYLAERNMSC